MMGEVSDAPEDAQPSPFLSARGRRRMLWTLGFVAAVVTASIDSPVMRATMLVAFASGCLALIVHSVRRVRPPEPLTWWAFTIGGVLVVSATLIGSLTWTSDPDRARVVFLALQLTGHVAFIVGFSQAARVRRRTADISSVLDALILALAIGLVTWRTLFSSALDAAVVSGEAMFVVSLLPALDIAVCAALFRRAFSAARTSTAFRSIMVAAALVTSAHVVSGVSVLSGHNLTNHVPFQIAYLTALAAAATHPSMRSLTEPETITRNKFGVTRITFLALALLDTPVVFLLDQGSLDRDTAPLLIGACAVSVIVVIRLISLAREMQQTHDRELRREKRFESLVRNSSDLIVVLDPDHRTTYVSPAIEPIMGYAPALLIGRNALAAFHRDDIERVRATLEMLGPDETSQLDVVRVMHSSGTWRSIEARAVNLIGDPTVEGIVVNGRDVTERVLAQKLIDDSVARQSAVASLGRVALAAPDAGNLTERAAALIRRTLDVPTCEILLFEGDAVAGAVIALESETRQLPSDARPVESVVTACRGATEPIQFVDTDPAGPLRVDEPPSLTPFDERVGRPEHIAPRENRVRDAHVLAARVTDSGSVIGAIVARTGKPRLFSRDEAAFLDTMAGTLGLALGRRGAEASAHHQALHDSLTGLPNRALFVDRLTQALDRMARTDQRVAVLFLDIDHFKVINDSLGHSAGDRVLVDVANRLRALIRPGDTVARFGGDEFTVLLEPVHDRAEAEAIAERIRAGIAKVGDIKSAGRQPTTSVGIALADHGTSNAETLLRDADAAMYQAKDRGRNDIAVFDDTMRDRVIHRLQTEIDLPLAIVENQLLMHYQPIVALTNRQVHGFEALIRWRHPRLGWIQPDQFIPVAELSGLIGELDDWVMRRVMTQCAAEADARMDGARWYSLNISARTVAGNKLATRVARILAETGAPPDRIVLEITESALMQDLDHSIEVLEALRALGVGIAVDDFGTGYSSLSYLKQLPATALKIDASFIAGLDRDPRDRAIVASVVNLAATLDQNAIAEGVETAAQLEILTELGCPMGQGYHLGRPSSTATIETLMPMTSPVSPAPEVIS